MGYTLTDKTGLPPAIFHGIKNRPYDKGPGVHSSISGLINSPRMVQLEKRLGSQLEVDAVDNMYALEGSAMHAVFEWASPSLEAEYPGRFVFEKRYFAELEGWKISGQLDQLDRLVRSIGDYKKCSTYVAKKGVKDEWVKQLNSYRWLAHQAGEKVDKLFIYAMFRDWSKMKALRGADHPPQQLQTFEIPVWSLDTTEKWLRERIKLHQAAEKLATDKLPHCTMEEKWQDADGYRIIVGDEAKARRVVDTKKDAARWVADNLKPADMAKVRVVEKVSDPIRCMAYCNVRHHCPLAKGIAR